MICVHALHVATGVYDFFLSVQGSIQFDLHLQAMHCHHDGGHLWHTNTTHHAIALSMTRTSPVYATRRLWLLIALKYVGFDHDITKLCV